MSKPWLKSIIDMKGQREDIIYSLRQQANEFAFDPKSLGLYKFI